MRRFIGYRPLVPGGYIKGGYGNAPNEPQYEGVVFSDGTTVLRWLTKYRSTSVWPSFEEMEQVHGHPDYETRIEWLDPTSDEAGRQRHGGDPALSGRGRSDEVSANDDPEFDLWLILNEHYVGHVPAGDRDAAPIRECHATVCRRGLRRLGLVAARRRKQHVKKGPPTGLSAMEPCHCEPQGGGLEQLLCREGAMR